MGIPISTSTSKDTLDFVIREVYSGPSIADLSAENVARLTLTFEQRQKSRQRIHLDNGLAGALVMQRGLRLHDRDLLRSECGLIVQIVAAPEPVTTAYAANALAHARACYHLGNRHLSLQVAPDWVRFSQDHVIDDLARHLGLRIEHGMHPFEPEDGAYAGGHTHHAHSH